MALVHHRDAALTADKRWIPVQAAMRRLGNRPEALIEALHAVQEAFGYIDDEALRLIGSTLGVPPSTAYGVATFYHYFRLKPKGEHMAVVCTGTACYIDGASELIDAVDHALDVRPEETSADGRLSVFTARCIGACSLAPATIVDGHVLGRIKPDELVARLSDL